MILDYKNEMEFACQNGISIRELGCNNRYIYFNDDTRIQVSYI